MLKYVCLWRKFMKKLDGQINRNSKAGYFDLSTGGNLNKRKKKIYSKNRRRQVKKLTEDSNF